MSDTNRMADWVRNLDEDAREYFEERAGIREYMAGLSREQAELLSCLDTLEYVKIRNLHASGN